MMNQCPVCESELESRRSPGLLYCKNCDIWVSDFSATIAKHSELIVEENREEGLNELRLSNSNIILDTLQAHIPLENLRICDVGCAYGWFVEAAGERGMDAVGIEPEESVALQARARGLKIKIGYFPDCLEIGETYDAIAFNDSLEHLPNLPAIFTACHRTLTDSGKLIINIPNSQGLFFKIAEKLAQLGYTKPWDRMWQKEYSFPHLIYVNPENLEQYVTPYGFELLESKTLDSVRVQGLWQRLRMDRSTSWIVSAIMYLGILLIYPFLQKCPSDILLQIYQKK